MKKIWIVFTVFIFLLSISITPQDKPKMEGEATYLVEMKHTKAECLTALDDINNNNKDVLSKINWGCMEGNHTGYMMVEAKSDKDAIKTLPESTKKKTKVYKLTKFTPEQIANFHK